MKAKFLIFLISVSTFIGIPASSKLMSLTTFNSKSELIYCLSCFRIPFKIKSLPVNANIDLNQLNKKEYLLKSINLTAQFTSKNPIFRKLIDCNKYPAICFTSTLKDGIKIEADDSFEITGNLTFHGISKPITVKLKSADNENKISFIGNFQVNMKDFGITPPILLLPVDNKIKTKIILNTI